MSQGVSILNPLSAEAMAVTLGRGAFLREIAIAALLSLAVPLACLVGVYLHISGANLLAVAIGTITAATIIAGPVLFYASFRLNAATLARERAVVGGSEQRIHPPLKGPLLFRRSMISGSVRSRILSGFPACIGFGLVFAVASYIMADSRIMILCVPPGIMLAAQAAIATNLLR